MASRDLESWMWVEAVRMLDHAERVERQFSRPGTRPRSQWEPPVDVYETSEAFCVVVALPGVTAEAVDAGIVDDVLVVAGQRPMPREARTGALHRLGIPHGRFERRLALPRRTLSLESTETTENGRREKANSC